MSRLLHQGLGETLVRACEGADCFSGHKSTSEGITAARWLNPGQSIDSGRCRAILTLV
ncbi:hypothetical protein ACKFKF_32545 [Phormidesmis sp. 146-12]